MPASATHLSDEQLAAWLDGNLSPDERTGVEAHLVACDDCRAMVVEARAALARPARLRWTPRLALGGIAAAAAVALLVLIPEGTVFSGDAQLTRTTDGNELRTGVPRYSTLAPPNGATLRPDTTVFRWEPLRAGTRYVVTITTERGEILHREETYADTLRMPAPVAARMEPGASYFWSVDARTPDLRDAEYGTRSFRVAVP